MLNVRYIKMKSILTALILVIPAMIFAKPEVIVFPMSQYFEFGKTNTFLVSIKNYGTNSIPIPSGLKLDNGVVLPKQNPSIMCYFIELTNGIPHMPGIAGAVQSEPNIDFNLFTQAIEKSSKDEVWDQLHSKHYLKPLETITYRVNWVCDPEPSGFKTLNSSMVSVKLKFREYNIVAPAISLYQKQKSNQLIDPTWTTPVLKAESDSQAGHE